MTSWLFRRFVEAVGKAFSETCKKVNVEMFGAGLG